MQRLRRETVRFKRQALDSLVLAIEFFNRPHQTSRTEAVLFFLQHAFEMLLKAAIYQSRGRVHEPRSPVTYRFDKCLAIARSDLGILTQDMANTLSILDGQRDCAMHHLLEMSEEALYLHAQAAVTMFDDVLKQAFTESLGNCLPKRVLPVSTSPPKEMHLFMDKEFTEIRDLIAPDKRRRAEAKARIRPYLIMESALDGECKQPTDAQVSRVIKRMKAGNGWETIFPGVATLKLDTTGYGLSCSIRITKQENSLPVRLVHDADSAEDVTLIREVNMIDRYSMGLFDLADKAGIGRNKCLALVRHLNLQADPECFKEFRHKSMQYKGYSPRALQRINEALATLDLDQIWRNYLDARARQSDA
jgi:hypothetical protein